MVAEGIAVVIVDFLDWQDCGTPNCRKGRPNRSIYGSFHLKMPTISSRTNFRSHRYRMPYVKSWTQHDDVCTTAYLLQKTSHPTSTSSTHKLKLLGPNPCSEVAKHGLGDWSNVVQEAVSKTLPQRLSALWCDHTEWFLDSWTGGQTDDAAT